MNYVGLFDFALGVKLLVFSCEVELGKGSVLCIMVVDSGGTLHKLYFLLGLVIMDAFSLVIL